MRFSPLLSLHICAAIIGLLSGSAALVFRKGSRLHRAAGNVFFVSMLSMSLSAVYMAFMKSETINVVVGVLTFYMVATGWMTVRHKEGETGPFEFGAMLVASADGASVSVREEEKWFVPFFPSQLFCPSQKPIILMPHHRAAKGAAPVAPA